MKKIIFALSFSLLTVVGFAQTWSLDQSHAKLGFSITHMMVSDVEGSFKSFNASIVSSKDDFSDAVVELTADVNSIDTDNEKRDEHLKNPDFFDAAKYPTMTFKSKSFRKISEKKYKLIGDLTLHGVTKSVELDVTLNGTTVHPYSKKTIAGFKVTGVLKRSDFAISKDTPSAMLSDEVVITANAEFVKGDIQ
jgi:polyisoprenoid-binding protein YceI